VYRAEFAWGQPSVGVDDASTRVLANLYGPFGEDARLHGNLGLAAGDSMRSCEFCDACGCASCVLIGLLCLTMRLVGCWRPDLPAEPPLGAIMPGLEPIERG